ncbi:MAG: OmpH family outer membrane protein [Acetobacteraceae bacterium]|nr:OmpH family outer membrane protein [Acetobacteraceae bacterium]
MFNSRLLRSTILAAGFAVPAASAFAQSNPGYFIPPQARPAPAQAPSRPVQRPRPAPTPQAVAPEQLGAGSTVAPAAEEGPPMQLQLPPAPELPALAKATPPPTASIGVLGIPEIMRASAAAQQVEKTIGERREKLNEDAQKEQLVWREMQQALANERSKLSADQVRAREKELQDRITSAQKKFRDRNRIIQEAGQYGLAQIERMLVAVIRQVSESHGMNIVLHRAQVALNVNEFDITDQVTAQLNKTLPTVSLPADGVEPPLIPVQAPTASAKPGAPAEASPASTATAAPAAEAPPAKH